jgi:hypothetical protein
LIDVGRHVFHRSSVPISRSQHHCASGNARLREQLYDFASIASGCTRYEDLSVLFLFVMSKLVQILYGWDCRFKRRGSDWTAAILIPASSGDSEPK